MTTTPTDPVIEMLIGGSYVDITADCRLQSADSGGGIEIVRGVPNEGSRGEPTQFNFTLNNGASKVASTLGQSSVYSPRNPYGPYYGLLGRNQPVRVGLSRWSDNFNRTAVTDGFGYLPDKTLPDGSILKGPKWNIYGSQLLCDTTGTTGTIQGATGNTLVTFGTYADVEVLTKMKTSVRDSEFGVTARFKTSTMGPAAGLDGTFESGIANWVTSGTSVLASSSVQFHSGTKSVQLTVAGSPTSATLLNDTAKPIPVTSSFTYRLQFWARHVTGATVTQAISWYDANMVFIVSTLATQVHSAGVWTLNVLDGVAPLGAKFARAGLILAGSPANGTIIFMDDWEFLDLNQAAWYTAYVTPGGTDQLRIGKVSGSTVQPSLPATVQATSTNLAANVIVNTYYWFKVQMTGQRVRVKFWKDGDPEPQFYNLRFFDDATVSQTPVPATGEVGFIVKDGTSLVTIDSVEINQWRAHTEIAELPPRWDLSRSDKWINVQSRGITRRLGQGRKSLESALTLHLNTYVNKSSLWLPLESDSGESAGNKISGSPPGLISGLTFNAPDLTGPQAIPGIAGYATLDQDTSFVIASIPNHVHVGAETLLFGLKIPNAAAADTLICSIGAAGTARKWNIWNTTLGGVRVDALNSAGGVISTNTTGLYALPDNPQGCWIMATLYIFQNGGNVDWAFNYHRPGSSVFFTCNNSFAGTTGNYNSITFRGSPALTAMGNLSITQIFHYAGDLPFVTFDFEKAAYAYIGELSTARFLRLGLNNDLTVTTTGFSGIGEPMGAQLPNKLLDLMEECAEVEGGFMQEERDDFSLTIITRDSMWNRYKHTLDIDAGHMSAPLDPTDDDQMTRNDVTVSRPGGGFVRSVQLTGPLNVNLPEDDPDGVGVYDEAPPINFATDLQLSAAANFRRSRGTQDEARYPSIHADLTATAYQASPALAAATMAIDVADIIEIDNPEVSADPHEQQVQSYTEVIDLYDWDITWVAQPASVYRVGVVGITTRVGSENNVTQAAFLSGTDTRLKSTLLITSPAGSAWAPITNAEGDYWFPFDIDVSGVRLRVRMVGDVLNNNPEFEPPLGTSGWIPSSANVTLAADEFNTVRGLQNMRITAVAAGTDGAVQDSASSCITVAGVDYFISGYFKTEVGATAMSLQVDWYQANNTTFISTTAPGTVTTTANVWQFFSTTVTAPALGARARLRVTNVFAGGTKAWVESVRMMPVSSFAADPQTLTVEQVPINGIIKAIPIGSVIRLAAPWRVGW